MNSKSPTSTKPPCECTQARKAAMEFFAQLQTVHFGQPTDSSSAGQPTGVGASGTPVSPLLTVKEGAPLLNRTESAVRHMIFQAESYAQLEDQADTSGFLECIVRPPATRRVFLHRERLLKLIDSWSTSGDMSSKPFNPTPL